MQPVDIRPDHLAIVLGILARHVPEAEVWVFGSRAKWLARDTSDLDLCIRAATPIGFTRMGALREAFEESNLPYKVDVVDWANTSESFRTIIERDKVVVQEAKQPKIGLGMSGSGFRECVLADIAEFRNGKALSPDMYLPFGQHPVFGSNGQIARTNEVLTKEPLVVIGRVGAYCGSVHHVDEPAWVSDNAIIATGKDQNDVRFLYYLLGSLDLRRTAIGSAQPLMTQGGLKVVPAIAPPLPEQKAIAHILGTLDDKIELNRRMNATLEAMARALFQSWFVDFDPVRAKLDGRQPAGLDATTAALFPAHFQESPLGHIPQGWEVRSLDQIAHFLNGLALQKYPPGDGETLPVIKIAQLRKGDSEGADRCNTELAPQYIVEDGDVLFSWSGSLEVELWCGGRGALNQHLFKVTSHEFPKWFYYHWTLYHLDEFRLIAADKATTMGHIQRGHLTAAKVLVPPSALLESMTRIMAPLIDQIIANRIQSRNLATIRDALLPKLLSGELSGADMRYAA